MGRFIADSSENVEISTTLPDGAELRIDFSDGKAKDVKDEAADAILGQLADDKAHPLRRARAAKGE